MEPQNLKSASWLARINANALLMITPEYRTIRKLQPAGYGTRPTFPKPYPIPMDFKTIAGVKVRYAHSSASSDKPTVLLLNPLPQSIVAYAPIWERLASRYNLYAYDLPGFGGSEGGDEWMTFEAQGRFLRDFIAEFGIRQPHLIGADIGMSAVLHYVTHFPNEVESLMIGDGPGIAPSKNGSIINKIVNSGFWRFALRVVGPGAFLHSCKLCYINYSPNPEEVSDYIQGISGRLGSTTLWFKKYPESLASVDPKLADIDKPVQIFWGDQDQLLLLDNAQRLSQRLKRSRLHVFKNCGHFSYQDKADEFCSLLCEWVDGAYKTL